MLTNNWMEFSEGMKNELTATGAQSVLTGAAAVDDLSSKNGVAVIKDQSGGCKEPTVKGKANGKANGKADSTPGGQANDRQSTRLPTH